MPGGGQPIFRLAVVGDSTAAGVGVDRHDQGVAGIFARTMAERLQRDVEWSANGAVHATLRKIRDQVIPSLPEDLDLVVLLAGVADALYGESLEDWSIDIAAAIEDLAVRHRHVIVAGMPPLKDFPVLPRALAAFLDERGREMDAETARVCAGRGNVTFASSRGPYRIRRELFASDGLHLSEAGYVAWANFLARQVPWM
ncbi:MAG: SGNH/GDSL hydrolase family protein [Propionibacteriaceae bacterium]|nr:SGNH/GDSL hydrolase family protein [Propionibacteriaceae bacterium]